MAAAKRGESLMKAFWPPGKPKKSNKKVAEPTKNCTGCARPVPERQGEPYPDHRSDCSLVRQWRLEAEPVVWKIEIGSFRVRCRRTGAKYWVESQTSHGYKKIDKEYASPELAFREITVRSRQTLIKAMDLALEKLDEK